MTVAANGARAAVRRARSRANEALGGAGRVRMVLILASVLGLSGADTAAVSATTANLERAFGVGNTQIGLLLSVVGLVGALFTIPAGILADRTRRTRLVAVSVAAWAVATALSGAAQTYTWLLVARVGLGAVAATTGPAVASLTGDYFPPGDRGRVFGLILGGELAGTGIGFIVSGDLATILSWRFAFWWLVIPSLAVSWLVWRLPEPARGGSAKASAADSLAAAAVDNDDIEPRHELILRDDPAGRSFWWAVRYVLRVRTNVVIIITSALGYFFFAGFRSFAVLFATSHYGISKPVATAFVVVIGVGALAGVYCGGRISDRLLRHGYIRARILVPAVSLLALPLVLALAIAVSTVAAAVPLLAVGAFLLGAPNPPMDAARLDIMPPRLWGRAEAVRTVFRSVGEAGAPVLFGYVSQDVFGAATGGGAAATGTALEYTFLLFLIPLLLAGLLGLAALRTYPRDVATALASIRGGGG